MVLAAVPKHSTGFGSRVLSLICLGLILLIASNAFAAPVPPQYFGMHMNKSTTSWPTVQFGMLRLWDSGTGWSALEPVNGSYNWAPLDQWLSLSQQKGVELIYTFGVTPKWAAANPTNSNCIYGAGTCEPARNISDWEDYVRQVATHSKGVIHYYEIWNEASDPRYFSASPAVLADMGRRAYNIIKSIDPSAKVLMPSSVGNNPTITTFIDNYFMAGGASATDIVTFHGYMGTSPSQQPEWIVYKIRDIKTVLAKYNLSSLPIWDTEASWGQQTWMPDYNQQAAFLARMYLLHWSAGAERLQWYGWEYNPWGTLWDSTSGIRPAGVAYREVAKWMINSTLTTPCAQQSDGSTWMCEFTRADGSKARAVWNVAGSKSYTVPTGMKQARDLSGNTYSIGTSVTIGMKPILLEGATTSTTTPTTPTTTYSLMVSKYSNRTAPVSLQGSSLTGTVYIFTTPNTSDILQVRFYLDGAYKRTEGAAPYDFNGGGTSTATGFSLSQLSLGTHTVMAEILKSGGTTTRVSATFTRR